MSRKKLIGKVVSVTYAGLFMYSGWGKLKSAGRSAFEQTLSELGVPDTMQRPLGGGISIGELVLGLSNLSCSTLARRVSGGVLGVFAAVGVFAQSSGKTTYCNCFGSAHGEKLGLGTAFRNLVLLLPGVFVDPSVKNLGRLGTKSNGESRLGAAWIPALGILIQGLQIVYLAVISKKQQEIAIQSRDSSINRPRANRDFEVDISGSRIPNFQLLDLNNDTVSRDDILSGGLPIAMVFIDPGGCERCFDLLEPLKNLCAKSAGNIGIVIISTKSDKFPPEVFEGVSGARILFQEKYEYFQEIDLKKVPAGLILDRTGTVIRGFVVGKDEVVDAVSYSVWSNSTTADASVN